MDTTISLKELLTLLSIVVAIITFFYTLRKDRQLKVKTKANEIRSYASLILEGIERWKEISKSIFYKCDFIFVETSELIKTSETVPIEEIEKARDFLWKNLMLIIAENMEKINEEKITTSYLKLFAYFPEIENAFQLTLSKLKSAEEEMIKEFVKDKTQDAVVYINDLIQDKYSSAILGNELRNVRNQCSLKYIENLEKNSLQIKTLMADLMKRKDNDLMNHHKLNLIEYTCKNA